MPAFSPRRVPARGRLFVYGTLRDIDLCERLLGPCSGTPVRGLTVSDAHAPKRRAVMGAGRTYPYLVTDPAGNAPGLLIEGLTPPQLATLASYEGDEYRLGFVTVVVPGRARLPALAFLPGRRARAVRGAPFALACWQARSKAGALRSLGRGGAIRSGSGRRIRRDRR